MAVIIHECGHLFAMLICKSPPDKIKISLFEIKITNSSRQLNTTRQNIFIIFFGPLVNFICFILFYLLYLCNSEFLLPIAMANLCTGLFNMLPVMSLDGGQLMYVILSRKFSEKSAERIINITAVIILFPLTVLGFMVLLNSKYNFSLLFVCTYLIASLLCKNNRYYRRRISMVSKEVEKLLLKVQKPGRYVGGELNEVIKDKKKVDCRFAFCFPDTYEVGMSHLGMKILYSLMNAVPYIWCERVFAPWVDMEEEMIKHNIPLYALESGDPVSDFDFIGFTLQYELSFTNMLNMLRLSGVPIKSCDRKELKNIVVAGGPCACNPEPIADFVDIFFIGEGEEVDLEVIELFRRCRAEGKSKQEFLELSSKIEGVYVPALYDVTYNEDGTIKSFTPKGDAPAKIHKRIMLDMDKSFYPDNFVVPLVEIVHDRAVQEIFRGCIRGCRFCQAGMIYRPVREKSPETINKQCRALCDNTGYDEVSLSSLSSSDYSQIVPLLDKLNEWSKDEKVSISLPSLRVDGFTDDIMNKIKTVRKSGLTFAPEAGSQRMRDVINKNVREDELLQTCTTAFAGGWTTVKLYFMIGLPTETMDDVAAIAGLGQSVVDAYYKCPDKPKGKSVRVTASASSFVPKPFTPIQWEPQDTIPVLHEKQQHIKDSITTRKIQFNYHDADTSYLEAVFARGDRKLCKVMELACERGFHFDGWNDCFSLEKWLELFDECGVDPSFYANRRRSFDEILPWDHIDYGVTKDFLIRECKKAYADTTTPHCRLKCNNCGAAKYGKGVCFEKRKNMV